MTKDAFKERGKAFEARYFSKLSEEKAKALKNKLQKEHDLEELQNQTGITDTDLLGRLLDHGITAAEITSLTLFPIAYVAWADGKLDAKEKEAIAKACHDFGITKNSATMELMQSWLDHPTDEELFELWTQWMQALLEHMEPDDAKGFGINIKNKTLSVAKASRSFLGLGAAISHTEQEVLNKVQKVLQI
ncbi:MAG: hypothetical protein R3A45_03295 [Bdellovibrionota bacterium]|nr:hypothetical protein [Deltaproteobacteria bacterium]